VVGKAATNFALICGETVTVVDAAGTATSTRLIAPVEHVVQRGDVALLGGIVGFHQRQLINMRIHQRQLMSMRILVVRRAPSAPCEVGGEAREIVGVDEVGADVESEVPRRRCVGAAEETDGPTSFAVRAGDDAGAA